MPGIFYAIAGRKEQCLNATNCFITRKTLHTCERKRAAERYCEEIQKLLDARTRTGAAEGRQLAEGAALRNTGAACFPRAKDLLNVAKSAHTGRNRQRSLSEASISPRAYRLPGSTSSRCHVRGRGAAFSRRILGGIKNTVGDQPLSLLASLSKGRACVDVVWRDVSDPVFMIKDLLPHLDRSRARKGWARRLPEKI
jgi:hypothetical protein